MKINKRERSKAIGRVRLAQQGFTLFELLLVIVIVGLTFGFVRLNAMPSDRQALENEAKRIALLFQVARDEAIVRNQPVAFEVEGNGYRFLLKQGLEWKPFPDDELLRGREFSRTPIGLSIQPLSDPPYPIRLSFGREPVDKPFILSLSIGAEVVSIRANGIGHFAVE